MPELLTALSQYFGEDIPIQIGESSDVPSPKRAQIQKLLGNKKIRYYYPPPELKDTFDHVLQNMIYTKSGRPNLCGTAKRFGLLERQVSGYYHFCLNTKPGKFIP